MPKQIETIETLLKQNNELKEQIRKISGQKPNPITLMDKIEKIEKEVEKAILKVYEVFNKKIEKAEAEKIQQCDEIITACEIKTGRSFCKKFIGTI